MSHSNGPRTGRPPVFASRGMVSTPHYLASASGLDALRRGGSAVDAAIAANATLCVAYPHMAGLGGDGFWLIAGSGVDGVQALDASGPSAKAATRDYYRTRGIAHRIPARGALAALTTPGAVDGWWRAHERFGKLPWSELFTDAIHHARIGVAITRSLADWTAQDAPILSRDERMAEMFLPGGRPGREGGRLIQSDLAETLVALATQGARAGFYEGPVAQRICEGIATDGSPLAADDFKTYAARWVEPISASYRGHDVFQMPPSTQGFSALQILNLLEGFDVGSWGEGTADYYHHIVESVKVAFADRDEWLTDPAFVEIPLAQLLSQSYANERRAMISGDRALAPQNIAPGLRYGTAFDKRSPGGGTAYLCAADADGLVVSTIQSIYHDFGAAVMGGDTGVILQNRGSFFSLDENHPNRLAPEKRTFHTIIPAMLMKDGRPALAYGSMGGEGQPQTQAAMLTRVLDFGFDIQQAIEAPRWLMGRTWGMESHDLSLESRISDETARDLRLRGHPVRMVGQWDGMLGHAQAIRIDPLTGLMEGGADPRGDGAAFGY